MPVEAYPVLWSFLLDSSNTSESDGCFGIDFENTTVSVGCSVDFKNIASFVVVSIDARILRIQSALLLEASRVAVSYSGE